MHYGRTYNSSPAAQNISGLLAGMRQYKMLSSRLSQAEMAELRDGVPDDVSVMPLADG